MMVWQVSPMQHLNFWCLFLIEFDCMHNVWQYQKSEKFWIWNKIHIEHVRQISKNWMKMAMHKEETEETPYKIWSVVMQTIYSMDSNGGIVFTASERCRSQFHTCMNVGAYRGFHVQSNKWRAHELSICTHIHIHAKKKTWILDTIIILQMCKSIYTVHINR